MAAGTLLLQAAIALLLLKVPVARQALFGLNAVVAAVRREVGPGVTLITPGVRLAGGDVQDQARVATPAQALSDGADLLVIGRPITGAADPGAAAAAIAADLEPVRG